jgi:hypothetical protein
MESGFHGTSISAICLPMVSGLVVKGINNVVVYIDDLIIHSQTHEDHLQTLDVVFT